MKEQLQQELKEKVKEGIKPSDLRKLERSKSAGDIPKTPPLPNSVPLSKSQSNPPLTEVKYPYTTLISQQQELEKLQKETTAKSDTISLLRKKIDDLETQLKQKEQIIKKQARKIQELENKPPLIETKTQEVEKIVEKPIEKLIEVKSSAQKQEIAQL